MENKFPENVISAFLIKKIIWKYIIFRGKLTMKRLIFTFLFNLSSGKTIKNFLFQFFFSDDDFSWMFCLVFIFFPRTVILLNFLCFFSQLDLFVGLQLRIYCSFGLFGMG